MADIQVTQEVVVELNDFHNVDLFQRGYVFQFSIIFIIIYKTK